MSNDHFDDIGVLAILKELRQKHLLHDLDKEQLLARLKSDWGKEAAQSIVAGENIDQEKEVVLRHFSAAF